MVLENPSSPTQLQKSGMQTTNTSPLMWGGLPALKTEWEAWWESLVKSYPNPAPELSPPSFKAFGNSPALQRVLQAHFGSALGWATDRIDEYAHLEAAREANGGDTRTERNGGGQAP